MLPDWPPGLAETEQIVWLAGSSQAAGVSALCPSVFSVCPESCCSCPLLRAVEAVMAGRQTKGEKEREKAVQDRVQAVLGAMLKVRGEAGSLARVGMSSFVCWMMMIYPLLMCQGSDCRMIRMSF